MQRMQTRTIDDLAYSCTQFPATKALKLTHRLGKFVAAPLSAIAGGVEKGRPMLDSELNLESIGRAVQAFFESCDEATFEATVKDLLTSTTRDGKPINFDIDFCGQLAHLFKVLAFVIEVNFSDFFEGIAALRSRPRTQVSAPAS